MFRILSVFILGKYGSIYDSGSTGLGESMKSVSKRKNPVTWQDEVKRVAAGVRKRVLEHTIKNNGGYLSQACSSAEILATLYVKIMALGTIETPLVPQPFPGVPGPDNPDYFTGASFNGPGPDRDRFFLSPAQYALVLYATLIETGRMAEEGLLQFNKDGSSVEMIGAEHSPGMETMTGSLGQGLSQAAGIAMARKRKKEKGRVFVFMSDGEFQIGQTWEALQSLSFHRLDNVIIFVDVNGFQCDGKMCEVMDVEPLDKRIEAFGARVFRVNGHDIKRLADAGSHHPDGRPVVVLCDTDAARGIDVLKSRAPKMHYVRFAGEEEKARYVSAYEEMCNESSLGRKIPLVPPFPKGDMGGPPLTKGGEGGFAAQKHTIPGPEIVSKVHAKNLVRWAADKPEVLVLSADLTSSTEIDLFRSAYPGRFLSMGVAEQNMLSFAAGLAREGFIPFVHTFAVFIYRRAYDQIAMSVAYPNLPVRMIGFLPGITTPGGATHQAIEDIAIMRSLPNMTVLECGDATEVESVLDLMQDINGPVYVRMLRGEIPRLFDSSMVFGKARVLTEGKDLVILSSGIMTEEAMRAVQVLRKRGLSIQHMHISTLKPFTDHAVLDAIARSRYGVITVENHTIIGGLGTIVAEKMAESGIAKKLVRTGLRDIFSHGASKQYLLKEHTMDALSLIKEVEAMVGGEYNITEDELTRTHVAAVHSKAKAEAL
jgi:transketolase